MLLLKLWKAQYVFFKLIMCDKWIRCTYARDENKMKNPREWIFNFNSFDVLSEKFHSPAFDAHTHIGNDYPLRSQRGEI